MVASPIAGTIAVEPNLEASGYGQEPSLVYGDEMGSYTTSLASNVTDYQTENNRRYHAYKQGSYIYPNDEKESDRLDIMHKLTEVTLGGKLNLAPIPQNAKRILDVGTGTGCWAMDIGKTVPIGGIIGDLETPAEQQCGILIGDKYGNASIFGNDLSPTQPRWVLPNVRFEVDDVEEEWTYHDKFDYIHCRFMGNAIKDWPRLLKQCFNNTKSGGWVECIDLDLAWQSPDNSLKPEHASLKFNHEFMKASRAANMEPCPGPLLEGWMEGAGFTDIKAERFVWPVGTWPADKHLKEVGAWNYLQITEGLEAFTYALFTRQLGYSQKECDVVCAKIRAEMRDPKMHAMFYLHVAYGKKP